MDDHSTKLTSGVEREENEFNTSTLPDQPYDSPHQRIGVGIQKEGEDRSAVDKDIQPNGLQNQLQQSAVDKGGQSNGSQHQLQGAVDKNSESDVAPNALQVALYDPAANSMGDVEAVPDPNEYQTPPNRSIVNSERSYRAVPTVGAFTVQCANCLKWRLTSKEKYEEIREHILEQPFVCETAREWRPDVSCEDPTDISQDGSRLWAIDKPNIPRPPPGWQRLLRIRGEGGTKFADVYYVAPGGKRLRSTIEIERYLQENPVYMKRGVNVSQFSFRTPSPLDENYVRKRRRSNEPFDVEPISIAPPSVPDANTDLQLAVVPALTPYFDASSSGAVGRPHKKMRGGPADQMFASAPDL
ncbi:methyl-CpG-binding domain-containing protein 2-like [Diospyros lotus]|uniref:methyl-CpG-binding domain-containing protein 2-like n=1 Tax=Diospyros lotus TaxID=55363 RepID=UPI0022538588|nr:methyl-CpG-binding domain-containing protein 2-like [Diospyros lotus]XP_052200215.1 methyl-CpG-binding domain-containing protein 2-like [Diospyros lotus]